MGQRVQARLPAAKRRGVTAKMGDERMCCFVARGREKKHDVPDQPKSKEFGSHDLRQTKAPELIPQASEVKISAAASAFVVQTGMLDSAKRSSCKKFAAQTGDRWNFGLCATIPRDPRQARKGATVAGQPRVPRITRSSSYRVRSSGEKPGNIIEWATKL